MKNLTKGILLLLSCSWVKMASAQLATISTTAGSNVTVASAISGGAIVKDSAGIKVTKRGVCWSTTNLDPVPLQQENNFTTDGSGAGSFISLIKVLQPATTYYIWAYAVNSSGTSYGPRMKFRTDSAVIIGTQMWSKRNLNVDRYRNGDPIPQVSDATQWRNLSAGAWCHYNNLSTNGTTYGKLYNWYSVNDPRGLCPTGWHVSTDLELTKLTDFLGGEALAGGKLKSTSTLWLTPNTGATNSSGFSGLPGGVREGSGTFSNDRCFGDWWSSTAATALNAWGRSLSSTSATTGRFNGGKTSGYSVRCVKD